jgi:hypothetical protein
MSPTNVETLVNALRIAVSNSTVLMSRLTPEDHYWELGLSRHRQAFDALQRFDEDVGSSDSFSSVEIAHD